MVPIAVESLRVERVVVPAIAVKTQQSSNLPGTFAASLKGLVSGAASVQDGMAEAGQVISMSKVNKDNSDIKVNPKTESQDALKLVPTSANGSIAIDSEAKPFDAGSQNKMLVQSSIDVSTVQPLKVQSAEDCMEQVAAPIAAASVVSEEGRRSIKGKTRPGAEQSVTLKEGVEAKTPKASAKPDGSPGAAQVVDSAAAAVAVAPPDAVGIFTQETVKPVDSDTEGLGINRTAQPLAESKAIPRSARPVTERVTSVPCAHDGDSSVARVVDVDGKSSSLSSDETVTGVGKRNTEIASSTSMASSVSRDASNEVALHPEGTGTVSKHLEAAAVTSRELESARLHDGNSNRSDAGITSDVGSGRSDSQSFMAVAPGVLEVGVSNGTHGWLRVRAQMQDGTVIASVASSSIAGREMLHRELPALTEYLRDERLQVTALVVKDESMDGLCDSSGGSGMTRQPGSSGGGDRRDDRSTPMTELSGANENSDGARHDEWNGWIGIEFLPAMAIGSGGWLNVRV